MPSDASRHGGASALPARSIRARAPSQRRTQAGNRVPAPRPLSLAMAAVALRAVVWVLIASAVIAPAAAEDVRELQWADLVKVVAFEDPFEALTPSQLRDLSRVARIRELQVARSDVDAGLAKELAQATARLQSDGIDIDGLLARREEVRQPRARRANAVVDELDGRHVRLPGYVVPLEFSDSRITEFLLVPWLGACIHTPPPPANQIVHVRFDQGLEVPDDSAPFWVEGRMSIQSTRENLFLVDGSADVDVGYALRASTVDRYDRER